MNDVADHCTVCHRCLPPCPVNIDFGEVTVKMLSILKNYGKRNFNLIKWASLQFLNVTTPLTIKVMRKGMLQWGYLAQRLAYRVAKQLHLFNQRPKATTGKMAIPAQVINFVKKNRDFLPMPSELPKQPMRALLGLEDHTIVPIVRDAAKVNTLAMLYELGTETVLSPGYLCCGYPQNANGDTDKGKQISTANQVLFHRVANTLNYMDIKTVIVSCGTCMDQLLNYQFQQIFPGCRLLDIHEYLNKKNYNKA
jgi:Fe-S oxidoreductase